MLLGKLCYEQIFKDEHSSNTLITDKLALMHEGRKELVEGQWSLAADQVHLLISIQPTNHEAKQTKTVWRCMALCLGRVIFVSHPLGEKAAFYLDSTDPLQP